MPEARIQETVGRDEELARLSAFLDRVGEGPAALLLDGEAGIGKTELWRAGVAAARRRGYEVLEARPAEAESRLSFAGLADLLAGVPDEVEALPAPRRRPLAVALLLEDASGPPPDPRAIAVAVLEVLRAVARRGPLLVAVDDVQWLDPASSAAVGFALRRAAAQRVGVLLARRSGIDAALEVDRAIPRDLVDVGPLSFGATQQLLRERLEWSFSRSTLRLVHDRACGNPFFALELARALGDRGVSLAAGDELPVPADLGRLLRDRLAALPPETAEALAAVAALAEPPLRLVGADGRLDPAFEAGVLVLEGERVRFAHPLLAAAAYDAVPPGRRRALHRRLAGVVDDPEQRARQLALGADGPDEELAAVLEAAAAQAHARGAPEAAAELAERAVGLDPDADPEARVRRVAAAARYHVLAGDDRRAVQLLEDALADAPPGPARARLRLAMARCLRNVDAVIAELEAALAEVGGDARLEAEAIGQLAGVIGSTRSVADGEPHARAAVAAAERTGDPALLASALGTLAATEFFLGRGVPVELMERALALEPECDTLPIGERPVTRFGWMCKWGGDVDRSRELLAEAVRIGDERGDSGVAEPIFYSCYLELLADDWRRGVEFAERELELGIETEREDILLYGFGARAVLLARLGDEAGTRRDAGELIALEERAGLTHGRRFAGQALGELELSLDRPGEALPLFRRVREVDLAEDVEEPAMHIAFPSHAEAAIAAGELGEAEVVLDWIEERAVRLDREWALACLARCRGLLAAARGDEPAALAEFERALVEHGRVQHRRFDLARTLLAQGVTLRRFRRKARAREAIEAAIAIFDELDSALWAANARRELARISGRRSSEGLTETERRVAELVATGRSNKEVASALHVTVSTVENNLTKIYTKLGVRSRTELAHRLST